jgi:peptidoglycan hydrolase-like protein with peptidoglycan-binding domain
MKFLFRLILLFLFLITASGVTAQQNIFNTDEIYGSDPLLYNGRYYSFFPPLNTEGNQYLKDSRFEAGSVTIRGVTYPSLLLNYDIFNQHLVMQYKNSIGAANLIILSQAWLETFSFAGKDFELISTQDTLKRIFQVMGTGSNRILYYWTKDLKMDSFYGSKKHAFSVAGKEMNLFAGKKFLKYRNNKSFIYLFDPQTRNAVKEYLRMHKINVKKAVDQTMTELIYYCNTLYKK